MTRPCDWSSATAFVPARPSVRTQSSPHSTASKTTLKLVNNKPVKVTGIGRDKHDALTLRLSGITFKTWARMGHMPHQGDRIRWWGNPRIGNMIARDVYREGHVAALEDGLIIYDASICFGDSGSGIFNDRGEVVGVISAMTDFNGCTFMLAYPL